MRLHGCTHTHTHTHIQTHRPTSLVTSYDCHNIHALLHGSFHQSLLYSYTNPHVNFIYRSTGFSLCHMALYDPWSTVSSASEPTAQWNFYPLNYIKYTVPSRAQRISHRTHKPVKMLKYFVHCSLIPEKLLCLMIRRLWASALLITAAGYWDEDDCWAFVEWCRNGKTEILWEKPVTMFLFSPQISHGMARDRTRASLSGKNDLDCKQCVAQ